MAQITHDVMELGKNFLVLKCKFWYNNARHTAVNTKPIVTVLQGLVMMLVGFNGAYFQK